MRTSMYTVPVKVRSRRKPVWLAVFLLLCDAIALWYLAVGQPDDRFLGKAILASVLFLTFLVVIVGIVVMNRADGSVCLTNDGIGCQFAHDGRAESIPWNQFNRVQIRGWKIFLSTIHGRNLRIDTKLFASAEDTLDFVADSLPSGIRFLSVYSPSTIEKRFQQRYRLAGKAFAADGD